MLFTWADGMQGKPGYVYQAANFIYAGFSGGEMYLLDGIKIHPRQFAGILRANGLNDVGKYARPTLEQMRKYKVQHYKGKQFRYLMFLCDKKETKRLKAECKVDLNLPRPKDIDLTWKVRDLKTGKWVVSGKPDYKTDFFSETKQIVKLNTEGCDDDEAKERD